MKTHCCLFCTYFVFSQVMLPQTLQKIANNGLATQGIDDRCKQGQWQSFLRSYYPEHLDAIYLDEDSVLSSDGQVLVVSFGELKVIMTLRDSTDTFVETFFSSGHLLLKGRTSLHMYATRRFLFGFCYNNWYYKLQLTTTIVPSWRWSNPEKKKHEAYNVE